MHHRRPQNQNRGQYRTNGTRYEQELDEGYQYQRGGRISRGYANATIRGQWRGGEARTYSIRKSDPPVNGERPDPLDTTGIAVHHNRYDPLYDTAGYDWHDTQYGSY